MAAPAASSAPAPVVHVVDNGELAAARATIDELRNRLADRQASAAVPPSTLVVTGTARLPSTPNVVRLNIGVSVVRPTVKDAVDGASATASRVIDALKASGVAAKDIQTAYVNVGEHWGQGGRDGYVASNSVTAKLRDVSGAGTTVGKAAEAGGDAVRINSLSFDLEENQGLLEEAHKAAMSDARRRAEQLATLAGRKVGRVLALDDNTRPGNSGGYARGSGGAAVGYGFDTASSSMPIEPGTLDTVFRVTVVYALD